MPPKRLLEKLGGLRVATGVHERQRPAHLSRHALRVRRQLPRPGIDHVLLSRVCPSVQFALGVGAAAKSSIGKSQQVAGRSIAGPQFESPFKQFGGTRKVTCSQLHIGQPHVAFRGGRSELDHLAKR